MEWVMADVPHADPPSRPPRILRLSCRRADHSAVPSGGLTTTRQTRPTPPKRLPEVMMARCSTETAKIQPTEQKQAKPQGTNG
ncbi:hypothetical protein P3T76_013192 [Phytophthora citrophthora]|uniref:Uncharacterized protein n=1 Tax=Phytophthora citrophthora TaxID=4793 RepID=A0AAD9G467_9STRA|nr:hypothetical protein P3T76_013192 [Phytophthora citrophthora]